jgi:hypothetical protein
MKDEIKMPGDNVMIYSTGNDKHLSPVNFILHPSAFIL